VHLVTRLFLAGLTVSIAAGALLRPRPRSRPRAAPPRLDEEAFVAGDGLRLPLARWSPKTPRKALALGLHSYGDYRQAFRLVGPQLADHGIELIAYDQRGFGETATRGEWGGSEGLILDLAEAVGALREASSGTPLVVIGESMGGSVALAGVGQGIVRDLDALILAAPGVRGDIPMRQLHDLALRLGALALPWLAVELRRGARPWLDAEEALRLAEDPLILRRLSVGTYDGLVELATLASALPKSKLPPTLLLHGELDRTIPRAAINELIARLAGGLSHRHYPERHHLLLHEHGTEQVVQDCLAWLSETLPEPARKRKKG
jgi:alpha-beta hydrolase superfamily lysophospholipase